VKVTILRSPGTAWNCKLTEGQTGTVDDPIGRKLVAAGIAVEVSQPKPDPPKQKVETAKKITTVPKEPAIAESKPASIVAPAKEEPAASEADKPKTSPTKWRTSKPPINKES